ncbi:uncharacterized protein [Asterias amurensis]|uniref:uncharacterized protein n=1 Tax=Asterias amurensis TaxID=7602 RepID=UPI003AB23E96
MSDSGDGDKMLPPLIPDSQLQDMMDHHAQRMHWLHQLIKMQQLFRTSVVAGDPQECKDVTMTPHDPRSSNVVDPSILWGTFPPGVLTSGSLQSRVTQSIKSDVTTAVEYTTSQSGPSDVTSKFNSRSGLTAAAQKNQIQPKTPAMIKQGRGPICSANSHEQKPLHPFRLTSPTRQLVDDSSDAQTVGGSPSAFNKKSLPQCPDLTAWSGSNNHQTSSSDVDLTSAWLDLHSVLDLSTKNANHSAASSSGSSLKKELRKSVITAPDLHGQQHGPCFSQDTLSMKHAHLARNSDQFVSPNAWSERMPFPLLNADSTDVNKTTSRAPETTLTSRNREGSPKECHGAGGRITESQVKVERVDEEYMPPGGLDSISQTVASESRNSTPIEQLAFTRFSSHETPFSKPVSKLFSSPETSPSATTSATLDFLESSKEQSLNVSSDSADEKPQGLGEQETAPEENADSVNFKVKPPPDKKCPICEDLVSGYHYGMYSCESCKGFFKRTIHSKRFEKLKCVNGGTCVITLKSRKVCASCRFQKCLSLGMKFEAIRSDRQRGGRSLYNGSSEQRRLSKLEEEKQNQLKCSQPKKRKRRESISCKPPVASDKSANSAQSNKTLTDSESVALSQQLSKTEAPEHRKDLKVESKLPQVVSVPKIISDLLDKEKDFIQQSLRDCCLCILREEKNLIVTLSHIINHTMLPLIRWVQGLPLYRELTIEDQIRLLHRSVLNLLCLKLVFYCLDNMGRLLMPQNQVIDLNDFSVSKFNQLVPKITNIGHQLHSNGLNMTSFVCLKLILLLNPDTPMLQNRQQVRSYQESIQNTFFTFMSKVEPKNRRLAGNLMLSLAAIERVCQQVTLETVCHLEVVDEMFRLGTDTSPEKPWIQCRFS